MTKEDVKNFLHENKKYIKFDIALTAACVCIYAYGTFMYESGRARGVRNVSDNVCRFLGYEKYEQLRLGIVNAIESSKQT